MSNTVLTLHSPTQIPIQQTYHLSTLYQELSHSQDPLVIEQLLHIIFRQMMKLQSIEFETSLHFVIKIFNKGYSKYLLECPELISKIMRFYVSISKESKKGQTSNLYYRSLLVLSIIAELIRQQKKYELPFTHEFLREIFELEIQQMSIEEQKNKLLAIITAIYSNLSRQAALIRQLKVGKRLKQILLQSYSLVSQSSTVRLMNQIILQLQIKAVVLFTFQDLEKYGIKDCLLKTSPKQKEEVMVKYLQKLFPRVNRHT